MEKGCTTWMRPIPPLSRLFPLPDEEEPDNRAGYPQDNQQGRYAGEEGRGRLRQLEGQKHKPDRKVEQLEQKTHHADAP